MAQPLQMVVEAFTAREPADIETAFAEIAASKSDALMVLPHPLLNTRSAEVAKHAMAVGLPGTYPFSTYADAGGMISLGVDLPDSFHRAAPPIEQRNCRRAGRYTPDE
jgi:putative ABC transport system substrate-binding protein